MKFNRKLVTFIVTVTAFLYVLVFFGRVVTNYYRWEKAGINVEWDISGPQFVIASFLGVAALAGWLLGRRGKLLSCVFAAVVLIQFYLWMLSTQRIKVNTGLAVIPNTSFIGNIWVGAGYMEIIALLAGSYFLFGNFIYLTRTASLPKTTYAEGAGHPGVASPRG